MFVVWTVLRGALCQRTVIHILKLVFGHHMHLRKRNLEDLVELGDKLFEISNFSILETGI